MVSMEVLRPFTTPMRTLESDVPIWIVLSQRAVKRLIVVNVFDFVAIFIDQRWVASYDVPLVTGVLDSGLRMVRADALCARELEAGGIPSCR